MSRSLSHRSRPGHGSGGKGSTDGTDAVATTICSSRPLPPLPMAFSSSVAGGNVCLIDGGQTAEWCPRLELGACGLDRPLRKGQGVRLEVAGTGYFSIVIRDRHLTPTLSQTSKSDVCESGRRGQNSGVIGEVKYKLKLSKFVIDVERTSRTHLHVLARAVRDEKTSKYDVSFPPGIDPWVTFNVLFGELRLTLLKADSKYVKPWQFGPDQGLNIRWISSEMVKAICHNPCAVVVTERPLKKGEVMEVKVQPQRLETYSEVKVFLTHTEPKALKLQNPRVYLSEKNNVDRFLTEVSFFKKFKGVLRLKINADMDTFDMEEDTEFDRQKKAYTKSFSLSKNGLHVHKPLYVCLELLRTSVQLVTSSRSDPSDSNLGYATALPGQMVTTVPEYLTMPETNDYLTPVATPKEQKISSAPRLSPSPPGLSLHECRSAPSLKHHPSISPVAAHLTAQSNLIPVLHSSESSSSLSRSTASVQTDLIDGKRSISKSFSVPSCVCSNTAHFGCNHAQVIFPSDQCILSETSPQREHSSSFSGDITSGISSCFVHSVGSSLPSQCSRSPQGYISMNGYVSHYPPSPEAAKSSVPSACLVADTDYLIPISTSRVASSQSFSTPGCANIPFDKGTSLQRIYPSAYSHHDPTYLTPTFTGTSPPSPLPPLPPPPYTNVLPLPPSQGKFTDTGISRSAISGNSIYEERNTSFDPQKINNSLARLQVNQPVLYMEPTNYQPSQPSIVFANEISECDITNSY